MRSSFDVILIQEADVAERDVARLCAVARKGGMFLEFGATTSFSGKKDSRVGRRVAILSRHALANPTADAHGRDAVLSFKISPGGTTVYLVLLLLAGRQGAPPNSYMPRHLQRCTECAKVTILLVFISGGLGGFSRLAAAWSCGLRCACINCPDDILAQARLIFG